MSSGSRMLRLSTSVEDAEMSKIKKTIMSTLIAIILIYIFITEIQFDKTSNNIQIDS